MFELKKTKIFQAIKLERNPFFRFLIFFKEISFALFILFLVLFLFGNFSFGWVLLSFVFSVFLYLLNSFFNSKLKNPKLKISLQEALENPEKYNLAEFLSFDSAKAVSSAQNNTTRLLYQLFSHFPKLNFVFFRALLDPKEIKKILRQYLKYLKKSDSQISEEFYHTLLDALKIAKEKGHQRVEIGDLLQSLAKNNLIFKKILIDANLKEEDIKNLVLWLEGLEEKTEKRKKFWEWENLIKLGSIGKDWAAGYTPTLDNFSLDISEMVKKAGFPQIVGHKEPLLHIERILARREINNVLIVGEPGSGRKSLVEALAVNSVLGKSLPEVNYKRILQLDLSSLLAQTPSLAKREALLKRIFNEILSAGNIILVIEDFHNFVEEEMRPGTIDITGILTPYLSLPQFQLIAITTYEGLHKKIENNPSLLNLFEKVEVSGVSEKETLLILENLSLFLEFKYKKFISYLALKEIVNYCAKYLPSLPFPEKAIKLLDEVIVHLDQQKEKVLLPKHVAKVFSEKIGMPVGEIEVKEKEVLLKLEELMHQRIINQEEAVKQVAEALRRARAEISARSKPMGSFLFLGPTGVGKTETSKALAEFYFGSEKKMIRLDMSEFQQVKDIPRLIGSPGEEGLLTTPVRENPFTVILLDEIEKAHPNILNLFLQILDEGFLTDGVGRKVFFRDTIIIATSNTGYHLILKALEETGEKTNWEKVKEELLKYAFQEGIFRPEFVNRFDAVVIFRPLNKKHLLKIAELMLQKIKKGLKEKEIELVITSALKEKIVELGYDPKFGAREMRRVIQDKVENVLARAFLSGEIKRGDKIEIDSSNFQILKK